MTYRKGEGNAKAEACLDRAGYKRGGAVSDEKQDKKMIAAAVHKHEKHDHKGEKLTKLKAGGKVDGKKSHRRSDRKPRAAGGAVRSVADDSAKRGMDEIEQQNYDALRGTRFKDGRLSREEARGMATNPQNRLSGTTQYEGMVDDDGALGEEKRRGGKVGRYARGGRTKEKGSKVNIAIVVPHGQGAGAAPMGAAPPGQPAPAPMPARPPMPPAAGPGMPPGAIPPHPPMKRGGRVKGAIHLTAGSGGGEGRLEKRRQAKVETR